MRANDPFLTDVLDAIRRRSKALKHKTRSLSVERFLIERDGADDERLEIECRTYGRRMFRLFLWSGRVLWIDAREPVKNAGWAWSFTDEGRLLGSYDARAVIDALEKTLALAPDVTDMQAIWAPMLAKGPQEVKIS